MKNKNLENRNSPSPDRRPIRTIVIFIVCLFASVHFLQAQVGIDVASPNAGAVLDLNVPDKDKGILIPKVNTTDWETRIAPVDGLMVYDENQKMFYYYDGGLSKWQAVNPFSYRKGSNAVDEDDFVLPVGNGKSVVIGTDGAPEENLEVRGNVETTGNIGADGTVSAQGNISTSGVFEGYGTIPVGGIIMWSGDPADVPDGWTLCNGTDVEGKTVPDLRGRFIVSYDDQVDIGTRPYSDAGYSVNNTGGEKRVTLTTNEMPVHNHSGNTSSSTHSHSFNYSSVVRDTEGVSEGILISEDDNENLTSTRGMADISLSSNTHSHTIPDQGGGQSHENRPPYFVLAFIMRVK